MLIQADVERNYSTPSERLWLAFAIFKTSGRVYKTSPAQEEWPQESAVLSLSNGYILSRISAESGINQQLWLHAKITVKPRCGGEKIKLPGRMGQHCLKKLFQETGIPPWERLTRPLIYLDDKLAAVAGLWIAEWAWAKAPVDTYQISCQQWPRPAQLLRQDDDIITL